MDGSMFADAFKGFFWFCVIVVLAGGASCFGLGYAYKGCNYELHSPIVKKTVDTGGDR